MFCLYKKILAVVKYFQRLMFNNNFLTKQIDKLLLSLINYKIKLFTINIEKKICTKKSDKDKIAIYGM